LGFDGAHRATPDDVNSEGGTPNFNTPTDGGATDGGARDGTVERGQSDHGSKETTTSRQAPERPTIEFLRPSEMRPSEMNDGGDQGMDVEGDSSVSPPRGGEQYIDEAALLELQNRAYADADFGHAGEDLLGRDLGSGFHTPGTLETTPRGTDGGADANEHDLEQARRAAALVHIEREKQLKDYLRNLKLMAMSDEEVRRA
jgi:hypothetical protein